MKVRALLMSIVVLMSLTVWVVPASAHPWVTSGGCKFHSWIHDNSQAVTADNVDLDYRCYRVQAKIVSRPWNGSCYGSSSTVKASWSRTYSTAQTSTYRCVSGYYVRGRNTSSASSIGPWVKICKSPTNPGYIC